MSVGVVDGETVIDALREAEDGARIVEVESVEEPLIETVKVGETKVLDVDDTSTTVAELASALDAPGAKTPGLTEAGAVVDVLLPTGTVVEAPEADDPTPVSPRSLYVCP